MYKKHNKRLPNAAKLSRRDFLKLTGFGFAAAMLPLDVTTHSTRIFDSPVSQAARRQGNNVLRVAFEAPIVLDPATHSTDSEVALANAVYDYLIDVTPRSEVMPRLAQSWTVSEDGLQYRFELAEGVKFHDGSDFSAADVIWTFNRLRDPKQSGAADLLGAIADISAEGDYTVIFTLSQPNPDFLFSLSDNRALVLKANTDDPTNFNGTGPFKMQDYRPEDRAILVRNEDYFIPGLPVMEGLNFLYFSDTNTSINALQDGAVDVVLRMPTPAFLALEQSGEFTTVDVPTAGYNNVRLRQDRGLGADPRVQKAFKLAVDRRQIFEIISFGLGAEGKDAPISPVYGDYFDKDLQLPPRNTDEAKRLLAEAGYPDGVDIELYVPNSGDRPDLAVAIRSQLEPAGIRVDVRVQDEGIYYSDAENNWLDADFGITGWGSRPTPQAYLELSLKTGAIWNESHYSDAELDTLIETAGSSLDHEVRVQAYKDIQALLADRGPLIIPYFFPQFGAFNPSVEGIDVNPFPGRTDFRTVSRK
jgi:peptide/nickel transport system substrate-binding protein